LGNTTIAGELSQDGTLSITSGNSINALGILYFQNSSLADSVDFFNGKVTIDKTGTLTAQTISSSEIRATANRVVGTSKIVAGTTSVDITSPIVHTSSHILLTPDTATSQVLGISAKVEGNKFTVSIPNATPTDIPFDWLIVNESQ